MISFVVIRPWPSATPSILEGGVSYLKYCKQAKVFYDAARSAQQDACLRKKSPSKIRGG